MLPIFYFKTCMVRELLDVMFSVFSNVLCITLISYRLSTLILKLHAHHLTARLIFPFTSNKQKYTIWHFTTGGEAFLVRSIHRRTLRHIFQKMLLVFAFLVLSSGCWQDNSVSGNIYYRTLFNAHII